MQPENARSNHMELQVDVDKLAMPEFNALWSKINAKSVYVVDFDAEELIQKAITSLNSTLRVFKIHFQVETGVRYNQIQRRAAVRHVLCKGRIRQLWRDHNGKLQCEV